MSTQVFCYDCRKDMGADGFVVWIEGYTRVVCAACRQVWEAQSMLEGRVTTVEVDRKNLVIRRPLK